MFSVRKKLYSLFLSRVKRDKSDDVDANLAQNKEMLGIDEETTLDVSAIVCGKALKETAGRGTSRGDYFFYGKKFLKNDC